MCRVWIYSRKKDLELEKQNQETNELKNRLKHIENVIIPKITKIENPTEWHNQYLKWEKENPEEAKEQREMENELKRRQIRDSNQIEELIKKDPTKTASILLTLFN